jgi:hypothetical protein
VLSWAAARSWLGVGRGWSEREGESVILAKIASGSPFFYVQVHRTKRI